MKMARTLKWRENFCLNITLIVILGFTVLMMIKVWNLPTHPVGESDDYMISTISLEKRLSHKVIWEDIEQVAIDFPEHYNHIKNAWENGGLGLPQKMSTDGIKFAYPWYFGTYSFACIPIKKALGFMGLNMSYAFATSNVFYYGLALVFLIFHLKTSASSKFFLILSLCLHPVILYFIWPSAEVFITALMIATMVFWYNRNFYGASLVVSLAGTLNPAVMVVGIVILVDFFIGLFERITPNEASSVRKLFAAFSHNSRSIFLLACCFAPVLISLAYNQVIFGHIIPQTALGMNISDGWIMRFWSYFFDLNLGFLMYMGIMLLLFFVVFSYGIWHRNPAIILPGLAFLGTVFAYSRITHINSGMDGIARYSAWASVVMIFCVVMGISFMSAYKRRIFLHGCVALAAISTIFITLRYRSHSYIEHTPVSKFVLEHFPKIYNPYPVIFASRTRHVDGGYPIDKPVLYYNDNFEVRKILVPSDYKNQIMDMIITDESTAALLQEKIRQLPDQAFAYINIPKTWRVLPQIIPSIFSPTEYFHDFTRGVYGFENDFHWISPDASIVLCSSKISKYGLQISFHCGLPLQSEQRDQSIQMRVFVNDVLVRTFPLQETGWQNIFIAPENFPNNEWDFYYIQLKTNGYFNPKRMNNSPDNRDLVVALTYIGPPNTETQP